MLSQCTCRRVLDICAAPYIAELRTSCGGGGVHPVNAFGCRASQRSRTQRTNLESCKSQIILEVHAAAAAGADEALFLRSLFDGFGDQGFRLTALQPLQQGRSDAVSITLVKVITHTV